MFGSVERLVAVRYLRSRRQEGYISVIAWFSLVGITLGVAALIIVMAVMNGLRHDLLTRILGVNGHITVQSGEADSIRPFEGIVHRIRATDGVVSATAVVEGEVLASANGVSTGAIVRGIESADFKNWALLRNNVATDALNRFEQGQGLLVGHRMASRMGLIPGTMISMVTSSAVAKSLGTTPQLSSFQVVGTFNVGMAEYDGTFIYMPMGQAQRFFGHTDGATDVLALTETPNHALEIADKIGVDLGDGFDVLDWQKANASIYGALQVERVVTFMLLTLIVMVAAFNIVSSQIMLVNEKAGGVAILRTIGASRAHILRIFFITGSSVGLIGTALGALCGISFVSNIDTFKDVLDRSQGNGFFAAELRFLANLPASMDVTETVMIVIIAITLSLIASVYPAWRAANLDPVEVLRYD